MNMETANQMHREVSDRYYDAKRDGVMTPEIEHAYAASIIALNAARREHRSYRAPTRRDSWQWSVDRSIGRGY